MRSRRFVPRPTAALDEAVRPRGAAVQVSEASESRLRDPDVVVDAARRALVVWTREIGGGLNRIEARLAETGLDFAGPVVDLSGGNASWTGPRVAPRDGGFLVMWNALPADPEEYTAPVLARRVSAAGVPLDEPFVVTEASLDDGPIALAAVPDGAGYVALWACPQTPAEPDELYLAGRRLAADGTPAGPVFPRAFGPDGAPRGSEVFFQPTSDDSVARGVRAVAPGTFVVAWTDFDQYGTDLAERSLATAIDADGGVVGGPTPITEPGERLVSAHLDIDDGTPLVAGRAADLAVGGVGGAARGHEQRARRARSRRRTGRAAAALRRRFRRRRCLRVVGGRRRPALPLSRARRYG